MKIFKVGFPQILPDNEIQYFQVLQAIIESVDELSEIRITRKPNAYNFTLTPSVPLYSQLLLKEILSYHNLLGIHLELSKSIRTTSTIVFDIQLPPS